MRTISLTQGYVTRVDDADYELLNQFKWCAFKTKHGGVYAMREKLGDTIFMHRQILGLTKGDKRIADHKDKDGLNNQRYNLRAVTHYENNINTIMRKNVTGYRGVSIGSRNTFIARMKIDGKIRHIGCFATAELASQAYQNKFIEIHGMEEYELVKNNFKSKQP